MIKQQTKKTGFTLIEMTIAIAFISILLITIALVTTDIVSTYRKGLAMKSVNSVGLDLIDDFSTAISDSPSITFANLCDNYRLNPDQDDVYGSCLRDNAYKFIFQEYKANIKINNRDPESLPTFGVFCTGKYSYIWNTGYTFSGPESSNTTYTLDGGQAVPHATLKYKYNGDVKEISDFRLLKLSDPSRMLCMTHITDRSNESDLTNNDYNFSNTETTFDITKNIFGTDYSLTSEPAELLPRSSGGLALYSLTVFPPVQDPSSKRLFYSASMILATISGGVDIMATGDYCTAPNDFRSDFSYCAVNKFNFAMRATGE